MKKRFATTDQDKAAAGRPRDAQTGRRILDAALELGLELGFDGPDRRGRRQTGWRGQDDDLPTLARHLGSRR